MLLKISTLPNRLFLNQRLFCKRIFFSPAIAKAWCVFFKSNWTLPLTLLWIILHILSMCRGDAYLVCLFRLCTLWNYYQSADGRYPDIRESVWRLGQSPVYLLLVYQLFPNLDQSYLHSLCIKFLATHFCLLYTHQRDHQFCSSTCFICVPNGKFSFVLSNWELPIFSSLQAAAAIPLSTFVLHLP